VRRDNVRGFKVPEIRRLARKRLREQTGPWLRSPFTGRRQGTGLGRMGSEPENPTKCSSLQMAFPVTGGHPAVPQTVIMQRAAIPAWTTAAHNFPSSTGTSLRVILWQMQRYRPTIDDFRWARWTEEAVRDPLLEGNWEELLMGRKDERLWGREGRDFFWETNVYNAQSEEKKKEKKKRKRKEKEYSPYQQQLEHISRTFLGPWGQGPFEEGRNVMYLGYETRIL